MCSVALVLGAKPLMPVGLTPVGLTPANQSATAPHSRLDHAARTLFNPAVTVSKASSARGPAYFGYYFFRDEDFEEVSDHTNLVKINAALSRTKETVANLKRLQKLGLKALLAYPLHMSQLNADGTQLTDANQEAWQQYVTAIRPYHAAIAGFYTTDEPYWNAWRVRAFREFGDYEAVGRLSAVAKLEASQEMQRQLEAMHKIVKSSFPELPIALVEAYPVIAADPEVPYAVPAGIDWVGFDCYGDFDNCNGMSIPQYFEVLRTKLKPGQKLIAVPPAFVRTDHADAPPAAAEQERLGQLLSRYQDFVQDSPDFAALLVFTYQSFEAGGYHRGLRDLDAPLREKFRDVGRKLLRGRKRTTRTTRTTSMTATPAFSHYISVVTSAEKQPRAARQWAVGSRKT